MRALIPVITDIPNAINPAKLFMNASICVPNCCSIKPNIGL